MHLNAVRLRQHYPAILAGLAIIIVAVIFPARHQRQYDASRGDVTGFTRDCVTAVLNGDAIKPSCQSLARIHAKYGVDVHAELNIAQGARVMTARRIARGDITTDRQYKNCVQKGDCVDIPVTGADIDAHNPQARINQAVFWHLVNDGNLTANDCAALSICKAAMRLKLITSPPPL